MGGPYFFKLILYHYRDLGMGKTYMPMGETLGILGKIVTQAQTTHFSLASLINQNAPDAD